MKELKVELSPLDIASSPRKGRVLGSPGRRDNDVGATIGFMQNVYHSAFVAIVRLPLSIAVQVKTKNK